MKKYPNNASINLACAKILCALILNEKMAGDIGDKGFVAVLVAAIRTHYSSEELIQWAMIALDSLSSLEQNLPKVLTHSSLFLSLPASSLRVMLSRRVAV
jgi:hypothetical protein